MATPSSAGGAVTLVAFLTMAVFTIWFGNFMLRSQFVICNKKQDISKIFKFA